MTGLELLLARAQLWQDTAARHVSLQAPLGPLAGLAQRWRRLELDAWQGLLARTQEHHAAGGLQQYWNGSALLALSPFSVQAALHYMLMGSKGCL